MGRLLTLEALEVLDAIDRKGSFAAAAAAMFRVPSAITYAVRKLEDDLDVRLFRKEGRRSVLTPAGRMLLEQGRELLSAADRLAEATRQIDSGWESCLNIAVDSIVDLERIYSLLGEFNDIKPDIEVNLYEEVLGGAWEAALVGRADLVLGAAEVPVNTRGLRFEALMVVDWRFVVAKDHPLTGHDRPLEVEDIQRYRAVVVRDSSRSLPPLTRRIFERQASLRVATIEQKIKAQLMGLGVGFLPAHRIQEELHSGALIELELRQPAPSSPLHLVWRADDDGRALAWFVERLRSIDGCADRVDAKDD